MPPHDGVRLHEHQRHAPVPPASRHGDPEQSGARLEMGSRGRASHGRQLLPQGQVLQDSLPMSTACQRQRTDDDDQQLQHASMVVAVAAQFNRNEFWRGSPAIDTRIGDIVWTKSIFGAGRRLDEMERGRKGLRPSG
jgi:hypothetical protein